MENKKQILDRLNNLWNKVPELSLSHLISLSVINIDDLYQMEDSELVNKVESFVRTMEHQKSIRK